jgi:hypothetical protein
MASHRLKLWTAAALAVELHPGLGCHARHLVPAVRAINQNARRNSPRVAYLFIAPLEFDSNRAHVPVISVSGFNRGQHQERVIEE